MFSYVQLCLARLWDVGSALEYFRVCRGRERAFWSILRYVVEGKEHLKYFAAKNKDKSVLWLHSIHHYKRRNDVRYAMRVSGVFKDSLDRQVME